MALDLVNLDAEQGKNIISDDTTAVLSLEQTSTGDVLRLQSAGGAALRTYSCPSTAAFFKSSATEATIVDIAHDTAVGSATVAPLKILASAASAPAIEFAGNCLISVTSSASICAAIRIKKGNQYYWIPLVDEVAGAAAA